MYEYFVSRQGMVDGKHGWLIGTCPHCGKDRKWGVHIEENKTNCFICGRGKTPLRTIGELENLVTLNDIRNFLKAYDGISYIVKEVEGQTAPLELPNDFHLITEGDSQYAQIFRNYLRKRGFNLNALKRKGIGYCIEGEYAGRVILPYFRKGKLVYLNARDIFDTGMKFLNPKEEQLGYGKNQVIYNWDALYIYNRVYLVESVTNALTLGDRAIALGGKKISQWQLSEIVRSPVQEIIIILDDDAMMEAYKLGLDLGEYKKVKVVEMPKDKDVNKFGKKPTLELVKKHNFLPLPTLRNGYLVYKMLG